jgi:DNA-binding transcriptional regulator YiaG
MANVAKVLRDEISRIGRKEAKSAADPISKSNIGLKKIVADLKRRIAALEKENKQLTAAIGKEGAKTTPKSLEEPEKARITSKSIRGLRSKLGLSQADFAKSVGVSVQSVHLWETKEGTLNLRDKTREALISIRGLGAKEAKDKLAGGEPKKRRTSVSSLKRKKAR